MNLNRTTSSGRYVQCAHKNGDYAYFVPYPLPPNLKYDNDLMYLGMEAQRYLSELGVKCNQLPHPGLFIHTYMKKEAQFSCQIEGTKASIRDVLEDQAGVARDNAPKDTDDIVNYLKALEKGISILDSTDISLWFIRSIHEQLVAHQPDKEPGKFRETQNQIGGVSYNPASAEFVPPNKLEMDQALIQLEEFIKAKDTKLPPLLKIALIHAQFETIHPFHDGNGRVGRILITLQLFKEKIIDQPVLYLSFFFKKHKADYDAHLQSLHDKGTWEDWLKFFLTGVIDTCKDGIELTHKIDDLAQKCIDKIAARFSENKFQTPSNFLYYLFQKPVVSAKDVQEKLNKSKQYTYDILAQFVNMGILQEITNQSRNKKYVFIDYMKILDL